MRAVFGDRYAGEWPRERFRSHGLQYKPVEQTKSELYQAALPLLTGQRAELLDEPRLIAQLCALERLTSRAGRDSISHPPGGHDDVANAAAGALVLVGKRGTPMFSEYVPAPGAGGRPTWSAADIAGSPKRRVGRRWALGSKVGWLVPVNPNGRRASGLARVGAVRADERESCDRWRPAGRTSQEARRCGRVGGPLGEQKPGCSAGCSSKKSQA